MRARTNVHRRVIHLYQILLQTRRQVNYNRSLNLLSALILDLQGALTREFRLKLFIFLMYKNILHEYP